MSLEEIKVDVSAVFVWCKVKCKDCLKSEYLKGSDRSIGTWINISDKFHINCPTCGSKHTSTFGGFDVKILDIVEDN